MARFSHGSAHKVYSAQREFSLGIGVFRLQRSIISKRRSFFLESLENPVAGEGFKRTGAIYMWRALFLALGITAILVGLQLFLVEQLEIKRVRGGNRNVAQTGQNGAFQNNPFQQASFGTPNPVGKPTPTVLYTPKDWMPWSLLAVGSIVVIYTFTIPRRSSGSD